jgi:bifunctional DNA-binding transcriptional regulator/antitoxin component of YhaV-PrlF toxin-antitoxin module
MDYKAHFKNALYAEPMKNTGEVRVSQRGQMSLPADARHRWGLDGGGEVGYLDVGDAVILIPDGVDNLRRRLFEALTEDDWTLAREGYGDPDLANE